MSKQLLSVLILALVLASGAFAFFKMKQPAVAPVVTQPEPIDTPTTGTNAEYSQHIEAIPGNADDVWYNIPELGLKMRMSQSYSQDVVYEFHLFNQKVEDKTGVAYLAIKSEVTSGHILSDDKYFAAIGKLKGSASDNDLIIGKLGTPELKQFDGYYVTLNKSVGTCVLDPSSFETDENNRICYAFQTVQPL